MSTSKEIALIILLSSLALGINACADIANEKLSKKALSIKIFSLNESYAPSHPQED